jgi:hypothetical protein
MAQGHISLSIGTFTEV